MQRTVLAVTISTAMLAASSAYAVQGHGGGPKPKPATAHAPSAHGPKSTPPASAQGPKTHGPKTTHGKPAGTGSHGAPAKTTHASGKKGTTTPVATTGIGTATLTPVQQKLQRNTNLASKLRSRLPAGTDLMAASAGFRNLGQFVAAVNVSNNLGIPFAQLKTRMVTDGLSLGQAIQELRPSADAPGEARRGERDAAVLIGGSDDGPTSKSKSKPAKIKKRG